MGLRRLVGSALIPIVWSWGAFKEKKVGFQFFRSNDFVCSTWNNGPTSGFLPLFHVEHYTSPKVPPKLFHVEHVSRAGPVRFFLLL